MSGDGYSGYVNIEEVSSAHRQDLDECAYLHGVLERLARGTADLDPLLPDVWKAAHPKQVRTFRQDANQRRAETRRFQRARRRQEPQVASLA